MKFVVYSKTETIRRFLVKKPSYSPLHPAVTAWRKAHTHPNDNNLNVLICRPDLQQLASHTGRGPKIQNEGRKAGGNITLSNIPFRAHASIKLCPHTINTTITHSHPSTPPTFLPVIFVHVVSIIVDMAISRKNPPTVANSFPLPIAHTPRSWRMADTRKAPTTPPGRPNRMPNGLAPSRMKL